MRFIVCDRLAKVRSSSKCVMGMGISQGVIGYASSASRVAVLSSLSIASAGTYTGIHLE
ncbi:MAG TPA: hypothetical protein V6C57_02435 [Coleofasciculaceae cyanobacterium]